jgi:hypothetical protein
VRSSRILPLLLFIVMGCSRSDQQASESAYDPEQARSTLTTVLEAWKKGETKSLTKRNPPIRFVDDDLLAGLRLADYEIEEPNLPLKVHQEVSVILSLRDARGNTVRREALYQVATNPNPAVLRSDH